MFLEFLLIYFIHTVTDISDFMKLTILLYSNVSV